VSEAPDAAREVKNLMFAQLHTEFSLKLLEQTLLSSTGRGWINGSNQS
jgi:hypothetical protein